MMLTHCGNNVRNRYSGCVFSVKDIVPVPLETSRNQNRFINHFLNNDIALFVEAHNLFACKVRHILSPQDILQSVYSALKLSVTKVRNTITQRAKESVDIGANLRQESLASELPTTNVSLCRKVACGRIENIGDHRNGTLS